MILIDPHYLMDDISLCGINNAENRQILGKQGHLPIVVFLCKMPLTFHYSDTLPINISLISGGMTLAVIAVMFKKLTEIDQPIRYFNRIFTIILEGNECWTKNEEL